MKLPHNRYAPTYKNGDIVMKSFTKWYSQKIVETFPSGNDNPAFGNAEAPVPKQDPDSALQDAIRLAWERYKTDTLAFFKKLAAQDPDIKSKIHHLDDCNSHMDKSVKSSAGIDDPDSDEMVPPSADGAQGLEDGGGGE